MDPVTGLEDNIPKHILIVCLLLCLLVSNSLYRLFQLFHYSRPPSQQNVVNTMYVVLSITYQLINIHSCSSLIVKIWLPSLGLDLAKNYSMSCIFILIRGNLLGVMCMTLAVISMLRYLKEYHFKYYQNWEQETLFLISAIACILPTILTATAVYFHCGSFCFFPEETVQNFFSNSDSPIEDKDLCYLPSALIFLVVAFSIILVSNTLPIFHLFLYPLLRGIKPFDNNIHLLPLRNFMAQVEPHNSPTRPSLGSSYPSQQQNTSLINLTFTTGFFTIIFSSVSMFPSLVVNLLWIYYNNEVTPKNIVIGYIFSVTLTTFLPIYWIYSNKELREFSMRRIKKFFGPNSCC